MLKKIVNIVLLRSVILAVCLGCSAHNLFAQSNVVPRMAKEAIEDARAKNSYLFLLFYDKKDDLFSAMEDTVKNFAKSTNEKVLIYEGNAKDAKEIDAVYQYKIDRAPLPVLLVIGPNGAVLGGFPKSVTADMLAKSLMSPLTMDVLKSIQQQKMAVVLLQNSNTKFNAESARTVTDLSYDKRLVGSVDIIKADPADPKNGEFLANAKIVGAIANATIVLIAPPGIVAGVFPGNATKDSIISSLSSSSSGGCSGPCAPGSCG